MAKINKHIEIVRSSTPALSSMGLKSCHMIRDVLKRHYHQVGITTINNAADLEKLVAKQPDLVFLGMKNIPLITASGQSEAKIWLSDYLESHGLLYTGSKAAAIELDVNKPMAKQVVEAVGLNTPASFLVRAGQYSPRDKLPFDFPLFIKPPYEGGGKGIGADSVVRNFAAFEQKVKSVTDNFPSSALVERYVSGREFSVAILGTKDSNQLLAMPIEFITDSNSFGDIILDRQVKEDDTSLVMPVDDPVIRRKIIDLAVQVFRAIGARDYGRIDVRLDESGTAHFLEANLVPGLANHDFISYFTSACWLDQAIGYEDMILNITELGLSREPGVNLQFQPIRA